jgi:hypothetical protein
MPKSPWDMTGKVIVVTGVTPSPAMDSRRILAGAPFGTGASQHGPHTTPYWGGQRRARHIERIVDESRIEFVPTVRSVPVEDTGQNHDGDEPLPFPKKR